MSAVREFLSQKWNNLDVLQQYALADQMRVSSRLVTAVRRAAAHDDETTWALLSAAASMERELHQLEALA